MTDVIESMAIGHSVNIKKFRAKANQFDKRARKITMMLIISFILKSYLLFYNARMDPDRCCAK